MTMTQTLDSGLEMIAELAERFLVGLAIEIDAQKFHVFQDHLPFHAAALADAGGEDDQVDAVHGGDVGADVFFDAVGEDLQGQLGLGDGRQRPSR